MNVPPVDVTVTPPAPESVNAPADVVRLDAAPASSDMPPLESIAVRVLSISTSPFTSKAAESIV